MLIGGCDPGGNGAIAFLDGETRRVHALIGMPMAGAELLVRELVMDIEGALDGRRVGHLFIEKQAPFVAGAKKGDGVRIGATTAFNIGQRYMAIKAIAACCGWPVEIVSPVKWQSHFGITKANKALSISVADQMMPADCGLWRTQRGVVNKAQAHGRAEAALIGLYGVRTLSRIAAAPAPAGTLFAAAGD